MNQKSWPSPWVPSGHQVVSRQNSPEFHHLFGWQLLKFTSKICTPWTKIEDSWIGFLIFSYFNQPTKPTNHLFLVLPTYLPFLSIHCEWQSWGLRPLDQHLLVVEHLNGCVYCDSASTPVRRQHCLQERTVVGNTTYFQRWLYLQRMIENHRGFIYRLIWTDFNEPFSGWLWLI